MDDRTAQKLLEQYPNRLIVRDEERAARLTVAQFEFGDAYDLFFKNPSPEHWRNLEACMYALQQIQNNNSIPNPERLRRIREGLE